ncbi:ANTAR domain-containing protein [Streptomyces sp. NPDC052302]|uniref:ANTAR domain-containing protein n=1 Tax=unclassified Streptomyces TaxID=2593676 RepID=UPI0037D2CF27
MHRVTPPREEHRLFTAVPSAGSSDRAWDVLVDVSQRCNTKLRDVAAALVATTTDEALPEPIQRELRRALRRLHEADPS